MKILGIDPGLTRTGVAILSRGKEGSILSWKILEHKANKKRLWEYFKSLSELIIAEKPDQIVIENIFRGPNIKTLIKIAELRGVYLLLSQMQGLPVQEF
ncbi:MAG: crossover junction endodeoxyribonuclease RuvC, partial [candidate division WOR-3 bacterium]